MNQTLVESMIPLRISESIPVKQRILRDEQYIGLLFEVGMLMADALRSGHKIFFFGNGGSAADSQHLAAEFTGRFLKERAPLAAIALSVNTSSLTAIGNDYSFDEVFARQLEALGGRGDVAFGLTTSGNSANILRAMDVARRKGIVSTGLTGESGDLLKTVTDYCFCVPSDETPRIQEAHIMTGHILCEIVEKSFSNRAVFLDRDGVINLHAPEVNYYVAEIEQFKILPGVLGAIRTLSESGFRVFVATNQRGVARKIVSWRQLQRLHTYLEHEVRAAGGRIDDFYVCAHDLSDGCLCRKPKPGLLLQAAAEHQVDLAHSWMIGDSVSDIEAGRAVGCRTALIGNGIGAVSIADLSGPTLAGIVAQLLNLDQIATN